jgi:WD40 repeat protein
MNRGKDKQIRLWDAIGGMCVQTLADCLGEITSVEFDREGKYLLAGCKDNSNRLFDLRMVRLDLLLSSFWIFHDLTTLLLPTSSLELQICSSKD